MLDLFPGATFGIGPPIQDGFYYDFQLPDGGTFTPDDLERIDARMREIIAERQPFIRDDIPNDRARVLFKDHPFKLEIIEGEADDPMSVTEPGALWNATPSQPGQADGIPGPACGSAAPVSSGA